jgi:hypothetical protein
VTITGTDVGDRLRRVGLLRSERLSYSIAMNPMMIYEDVINLNQWDLGGFKQHANSDLIPDKPHPTSE